VLHAPPGYVCAGEPADVRIGVRVSAASHVIAVRGGAVVVDDGLDEAGAVLGGRPDALALLLYQRHLDEAEAAGLVVTGDRTAITQFLGAFASPYASGALRSRAGAGAGGAPVGVRARRKPAAGAAGAVVWGAVGSDGGRERRGYGPARGWLVHDCLPRVTVSRASSCNVSFQPRRCTRVWHRRHNSTRLVRIVGP
jgi:hypothetical protein